MSAHNGSAQPRPVLFSKEFLDELRALTPMASLVGRRVKLTRSGADHKGCCPFHDDRNPSLWVYSDHFHCFACEAHGDAIEFVTRTEDIAFPDAVARLASDAGLPLPDTYTPRAQLRPSPPPQPAKAPPAKRENWRPMVPPPADAPSPTPAQLRCDMLHTYLGAQGELLCYVRRFEAKGGERKRFVPLTYGTLKGRKGWHSRAPDASRPLYGLDRLAARPDAPVMVCEGEKAADAAQGLFPDLVCVAWPGGTGAVAKADWRPLIERRTGKFVWPDNDAPGRKAAAEVAALLPGAQLLRVDDLPAGADAADVMPDHPEVWMRDRLPEPEQPKPGQPFGRLRVLSVEDALNAPPRTYLLDGMLAPAELSVWWGPPKSGKSFLLMRVLYGLAQGQGMWGRDAAAAPVLYVAAEGVAAIGNRLRALRDTLGIAPGFHLVAQSVNLFDPAADLSDLIEAVRWTGAKVVALDTLARVMVGGDENQTRDMNVFVANCDRIREETGAHVAVVHHGGWDGSHARGSIALIGAADLVMKVSGKRGEPHSAQIEYAKDDRDGETLGFDLEAFELPPDANGKPRSTCLAVATDAPLGSSTGKGGRIDEEAATLLREIHNAFATGQGRTARPKPDMPDVPTIDRKVLQAALIQEGWLRPSSELSKKGETMESLPAGEQTRLWKRLNHLKLKGLIGHNRRDVWLVKAAPAP